MLNLKIYFILTSMCLLMSCGSGDLSHEDNTTVQDDPMNSINQEKLKGSPFEGLSTGDSIDFRTLLQGKYLTRMVDRLPFNIFLAAFTQEEEEKIEEGINLANQAIGFTAFELTDQWRDDVRVIYKVNDIQKHIDDPRYNTDYSVATTIQRSCNVEGKIFSDLVVTDWEIAVSPNIFADNLKSLVRFIIAHELGHAFGLGHSRIDYVEDTLLSLEPHSIMKSDLSAIRDEQDLTEYNLMMGKQGELLSKHLGEDFTEENKFCFNGATLERD